jgi:hypothetical protein
MSPIKPVALATMTLSRQTVEATTDDALSFLRAVGKYPAVRESLGRAGYSDADTERGWALVRNVMLSPKEAVAVAENPVATATAEVDAWRTTGLAIVHSALTHMHPEQEAFLFEGLDVGNAAESVLTASIFLERCDQLEGGKDRKAMHKADLAALATLEARGLTKAERKHLRALVTRIETRAAPLPNGPVATTDEREARVHALRAWIVDWKNVAKIVIKRRDWLLALGVGKRRSRKAAPMPVAPATPATPRAPAVAPPVDSSVVGATPAAVEAAPASRAA